MAQCLKCGKKAAEKSVFCSECLEVMDRYPVKPGTVVHIPHRPSAAASKKTSDYEEINQKEQLAYQNGIIRWLTAIIAGLSILLVITAVLLIRTLDKEQPVPVIGKNYTTSNSVQNP